jgi:hypothetical protein
MCSGLNSSFALNLLALLAQKYKKLTQKALVGGKVSELGRQRDGGSGNPLQGRPWPHRHPHRRLDDEESRIYRK